MKSNQACDPHDPRLALGYGSAWHLLRCLGWRRDRFSKIISEKIGADRITWLDFTDYDGNRQYRGNHKILDGEWKRLAFIKDKSIQDAYDKFWPKKGEQQNWDAIGKAVIKGVEEWLLVEAKAHSGEIGSDGNAKENGGRPMIRESFKKTIQALGYERNEALMRAEEWFSGYYQYANRLATLYFLAKENIPARLVFIYFCGDNKRPDGQFCPRTEAEWEPRLGEISECLGLTGKSELEKRICKIFVNVNLEAV